MAPGPIPPHEREWRHPSELSPTRFDVDDEDRSAPSRRRMQMLVAAVIVGGVVAIVAVTTTPSPATSPVALEATTLPPFVTTARRAPAPSAAMGDTPAATLAVAGGAAPASIQFAATVSVPAELAVVQASDPEVASELPQPTETVMVLSESGAYLAAWHDIAFCDVDEGVVVNADGDVVANVADGVLTATVRPPSVPDSPTATHPVPTSGVETSPPTTTGQPSSTSPTVSTPATTVVPATNAPTSLAPTTVSGVAGYDE